MKECPEEASLNKIRIYGSDPGAIWRRNECSSKQRLSGRNRGSISVDRRVVEGKGEGEPGDRCSGFMKTERREAFSLESASQCRCGYRNQKHLNLQDTSGSLPKFNGHFLVPKDDRPYSGQCAGIKVGWYKGLNILIPPNSLLKSSSPVQ